ncbi:hypothetical protein K443DRAFT_679105 [Laccaria amethystina LaAM-08-1]|uniref:Uncharacterized protein n=1 Tax=Laccaria amethystina LaAM-08-1 TaxID=1095629 RepID=A0A0C9XG36_9AGAR|nr:hypothetical protein K443DRAFT_679105 [Laccaria amethystina LaAM-08-1]
MEIIQKKERVEGDGGEHLAVFSTYARVCQGGPRILVTQRLLLRFIRNITNNHIGDQ